MGFFVSAKVEGNVEITREFGVGADLGTIADFEEGGVVVSDTGAVGVVKRIDAIAGVMWIETTSGEFALGNSLDNEDPYVESKMTVASEDNWFVRHKVINPQENSYSLYWTWDDDAATMVTITPRFADVNDPDVFYARGVKDFTTGELVPDATIVANTFLQSSMIDSVMRNEVEIEFEIEPDISAGDDTMEVLVRTNNLYGRGNRG